MLRRARHKLDFFSRWGRFQLRRARNRAFQALELTSYVLTPRRPCRHLVVEHPQNNDRLVSYLSWLYGAPDETLFEGLINDGAVHLNKRRAAPGDLTRHMDFVEIKATKLPAFVLTPLERPLNVIYMDRHIAVVEKQPGDLCIPPPNRRHAPCVAGSLLSQGISSSAQIPNIHAGLAHRLDRFTGGLLVAARTPAAKDRMTRLFRQRKVRKQYLAIVGGELVAGGVIDAPISRDRKRRWAFRVSPRGHSARTEFSVHEPLSAAATELKVRIHTGRTHQIRVHMANMGHPLVGDFLYGGLCLPETRQFLLHAAQLEFEHPFTGELMSFSSTPSAAYLEDKERILRGEPLAPHPKARR